MDSVYNFINTIDDFYDYKEPAYTVDIGYQKTQDWIRSFSSFKQHFIRHLSEIINRLALFSTLPEYVNLTPEQASKKIFENEVLENELNFEYLKLTIQSYLEKRITALKEELDSESDL